MATAKEIGIGIKNARLTVGITQAELARRLGVTPQAISQYERGEKKPKIETIKKIADALGVSWFQLSHLDDLVATSEERVLDKEEVYQSIAVDYTTAELFVMASEPEASRVAFLNNVAMTIPEDASGCIDMDAEKKRLSVIWGLAHLSMRELISRTGMSQTAFAKCAGIPLRTVQNWCAGSRDCPAYVRFLLAEHYKLL
ncbi:MAG: helix-turn-helix domain-containing protein [Faecalibacterium prausnitzii]|jgi:transcriptional regulator with XRE-family HTH domain|nr:MAG TPA: Repressor protein CI [Caudoviricetes sp.]